MQSVVLFLLNSRFLAEAMLQTCSGMFGFGNKVLADLVSLAVNVNLIWIFNFVTGKKKV